MKIKEWVKIEKSMTDLMGWKKGIEVMCEMHHEVAPKKPIYEFSKREDRKIIFRLRKSYLEYKERNKNINADRD
tara:strand:- start:1512 stop:1733 length:222 start_codon:yes stop_codon:yes gene_type:complete